MLAKLGYDSFMKRLNSATVAAFTQALGVMLFLGLASAAVAQINGVPASTTSINFGGHLNSAPGVPASVTSLGANGLQPMNPFFNQPGCCFNQLFPVNSNPPFFQHRRRFHRDSFFPAGGAVYPVPYAVPYAVTGQPDDSAEAEREQQEEDAPGGPTIFDRRGSGPATGSYRDSYPERARRTEPAAGTTTASIAEPAEIPVADQPQTVLVFKDGHRIEVQNYAVAGDMLYDLTPGRHPKIAIADLDLSATAKQNEERGISFQLPPMPKTNK